MNSLPFIMDVVVVISAKVLVVKSHADVMYIADVVVLPSSGKLPCAKHTSRSITLKIMTFSLLFE